MFHGKYNGSSFICFGVYSYRFISISIGFEIGCAKNNRIIIVSTAISFSRCTTQAGRSKKDREQVNK